MNKRIKDKIEEIEKYLSELEDIKLTNLEEYLKDIKTKAAYERYAEKISESLVDLAYLVVKQLKLKVPENDSDTFNILLENNLISRELCDRLQDAKGMRNILAHKYGEVDNEIVFNAINKEFTRDTAQFIKSIRLMKT